MHTHSTGTPSDETHTALVTDGIHTAQAHLVMTHTGLVTVGLVREWKRDEHCRE